MNELVTEITACRSCGSGSLEVGCDFGEVALNAFPLPGDPPVETAPITVVICSACHLAQLRHTVNRQRLFTEYWYRSSTQEQMLRDLKDAVDYGVVMADLKPGQRVLSIGVNDASEMLNLPSFVEKVGIDPAKNLRGIAKSRCDVLITDYFPSPQLPRGPYQLVLSLACLYSVDNLRAVCDEVYDLLADDGVWVVQVSYAPKTFSDGIFGDLTHEHVAFFSVETLANMLALSNLHISDYQMNDVNGGSVRVTVRKGLGQPLFFNDAPTIQDIGAFAKRTNQCGNEIRQMLSTYKQDGVLCGGYGASTKGNLCLSHWHIGPDLLPWIADRNPDKWGRTSVTGIPIIAEDEARALNPDVLLLLIPQFLESIRTREVEFLSRGGRLLLPFPVPHYDDALQAANPEASYLEEGHALPCYSMDTK